MRPLGQLTAAREILKRHFGFSGFRPGQLRVIGPLLAGRDVLAILPTGGGKSLCYQIPALLRDDLTLVVSPLISLMQDQVGALRARGVPAAMLNRALSSDQEHETYEGLGGGRWRLLYVAPERIHTLLPRLPPVGLLAVDEAHCVSEWGLSFRPAYRRLAEVRVMLRKPQAVALTGTATPEVRRDIVASVGLRHPELVLGTFDRPNLTFAARRCDSDTERFRILCRLLGERDVVALVYAPTRKLVEDLTRSLLSAGFRAAPYHAGLEQPARRRILSAYLANRLQVVAATSAFGMGIDKPDVRLVVHWGPPPSPEAYYQEAGRAGRDGALAQCVCLFTKRDVAIRHAQLRQVQGPRAAADRHRFEGMTRYLYVRTCRRAALLGYFGELLSGCTGCDRCGDLPRRRAAIRERPDGSPSSAPRATPARPADHPPDPRLVRRLMSWRRRTARRAGLPESCLLAGDAILALARARPTTAVELADVEGIGPELAARHGRSLLSALAPAPRREPEPAPSNPELVETLRGWRARIAREAGLPAYCVLSNRALRGIAEALPEGRADLTRVPGVGPRALAKYATVLLDLVATHRASLLAGAEGNAEVKGERGQ